MEKVLTIGIPSFVLALEPNNERINGRIIINVLRKCLPTALTIVANILIILALPEIIRLDKQDISTLAVILTGFTGFMLLYRISVPFNNLRRILFVFLICLFVFGIVFLRDLFSLTILTPNLILLALILLMIAVMMFNVFTTLCDKLTKKIKI